MQDNQQPPPPIQPGQDGIEAKTGQIAQQARDLAIKHGPPAVGALVLFIVAWAFAAWVRRALRRALLKTRLDQTLVKFVSNLAKWVIIAMAAITCLSLFGIVPTSFAALIGAVTLAIGLGFQGSLSNLAAGVMLLTFRPFKVGDVVVVAGQLGRVNEIDMMITEIDTPDGRRVSIPNSQVIGGVIENITHHPRRRVDIPVGVAYAADIDATRAALERAVRSVKPRLDEPPPEAILQELGSSSVNWVLRVWTARDDFFATRQATIRAAKMALDDAGISIPFPQMDVWVRAVPPGMDAAGALGAREVKSTLPSGL
ncbi:MAG: mechanosensitive ion channel family protein [Phycisphaerales bacterium]